MHVNVSCVSEFFLKYQINPENSKNLYDCSSACQVVVVKILCHLDKSSLGKNIIVQLLVVRTIPGSSLPQIRPDAHGLRPDASLAEMKNQITRYIRPDALVLRPDAFAFCD